MLRLFLRARAEFRIVAVGTPDRRAPIVRAVKAEIRKRARVTHGALDLAWMGRLNNPDDRVRIWGALGIVPADYGVTLTHGGQEPSEVTNG
nr:hypothetical protein [Mesorhizobium sp. RMAD-H1]